LKPDSIGEISTRDSRERQAYKNISIYPVELPATPQEVEEWFAAPEKPRSTPFPLPDLLGTVSVEKLSDLESRVGSIFSNKNLILLKKGV
jgi:hypothetical protein